MFSRRARILPSVALALRGRWLAIIACAVADEVRAPGASAATMATYIDAQEASEKLLLYYDRFSFYSQKVVMVLHEKNLPFDSRIVNLIKSESYESWFLDLNPKGEVPVLQDTGKIIPDSARIIDYLEDNFSNGDNPRLIPMDRGPQLRQKVTHLRAVLQKAPAGMLTTGAMIHQHMLKNPKTPFYAPVRKALDKAERNSPEHLRKCAEKNPAHRDVLLKKAEAREKTYKELSNVENFKEVLNKVHVILDEMEAELASHTGDKEDYWLCSDTFTIADVELTTLLIRISQLGLEHIFWSLGKRPLIEAYYERVKLRSSYKKTIPGTLVLLKTILMANAPVVIGVVTVVAMIIGGAIIGRKFA